MNCESCGGVIPDNALMCPNCGAATSASQQRPQLPNYTPPQQGYIPPQQNYGYAPQFYPPPYAPGVNVTVVNNANKSNTPVLVEVLLSLFLGKVQIRYILLDSLNDPGR